MSDLVEDVRLNEGLARAAVMRDLVTDAERVRSAAEGVCAASEVLARAANGTSVRVMPAAVVYDVLAAVKVGLHNLIEVTTYLPHGLVASLSDPRIRVYHRDVCGTGEPRDPVVSVAAARVELDELTQALEVAAGFAEMAQRVLNGQGYEEVDA